MKLLSLITALCMGLAVGCLVGYIGQLLRGVELDKRKSFDKPLPLLFRLVFPLLTLVRPLVRHSSLAAWSEKIESKLLMAGYAEVLPAVDFIGLKLLFYIIGLLWAFLGMLSAQPIPMLIVALLIANFPALWLSGTIKKRQLSIMKALPNVLDLLTLSVESGRDLVSALRDILARRRVDDLGEELSRAFQEIQLGRKRSDALRAMAQRVNQVDLSATVNAIVQAEELGVEIAQLLRIQGDAQRNKRFSLAEKLANEASVKIIIPVVLFILPAVFIILLGPLITQAAGIFR